MSLARPFFGALLMHLRLYATHYYRVFQVIVRPALMALMLVLVLRSRAHEAGYFRVLMGAALVGMWTALIGTAAFTVLRERLWYGTFELLVGVPRGLAPILGGYLTGEALIALAAVPVSFGVGWLLLGAAMPAVAPPLFLLSVIVAAYSLWALAMVLAPLVMLAPSLTNWINLFENPLWILAGFLFPIAILPQWTTPLSDALPPYWAANALEAAAKASPSEVLYDCMISVSLATVYAAVSIWLLALASHRLRKTAALVSEG